MVVLTLSHCEFQMDVTVDETDDVLTYHDKMTLKKILPLDHPIDVIFEGNPFVSIIPNAYLECKWEVVVVAHHPCEHLSSTIIMNQFKNNNNNNKNNIPSDSGIGICRSCVGHREGRGSWWDSAPIRPDPILDWSCNGNNEVFKLKPGSHLLNYCCHGPLRQNLWHHHMGIPLHFFRRIRWQTHVCAILVQVIDRSALQHIYISKNV